MKYRFFFIFIMLGSTLFSQMKIEIEKKVSKDIVPTEAINWITKSYANEAHIKWIFEQSDRGKSYEAKLKYGNAKHSIEFNRLGQLEDIEVTVKWNKIDTSARKAIKQNLQERYEKYVIKKVQIQYSGPSDLMFQYPAFIDHDSVQINYEIEYYGKKNGNKKIYEGLFNHIGELLQFREIKPRPDTHLIY